jgi:hypothetical protein
MEVSEKKMSYVLYWLWEQHSTRFSCAEVIDSDTATLSLVLLRQTIRSLSALPPARIPGPGTNSLYSLFGCDSSPKRQNRHRDRQRSRVPTVTLDVSPRAEASRHAENNHDASLPLPRSGYTCPSGTRDSIVFLFHHVVTRSDSSSRTRLSWRQKG